MKPKVLFQIKPRRFPMWKPRRFPKDLAANNDNNKMDTMEEKDFGTHRTGMYVPDGFFADFQKNMDAKIDAYEATKPVTAPVIEMHRKTRSLGREWLVAACACFVLALCVYPFWNEDKPLKTDSSLTATSEEASALTNTDDLAREMVLATVSDLDIYEYFYEE